MNALGICQHFRDEKHCAPTDDQGRYPPSNTQLRRWLDQGSVSINGIRTKALDEIQLPVTELVFFPGKKRQTTLFG